MRPSLETPAVEGSDSTDLRVLVLAPYPTRSVPSQRFRFEQYMEPLREDGIHLEVSSYWTAKAQDVLHSPGQLGAKTRAVARGFGRRLADLVRSRHYDLVLVGREALPLGYPVVERTLAAIGVPYAFDLDDAIYLPNASVANRRFAWLKYSRKAEIVARHATLVIAGNEDLASWARGHSESVTVIPTTIDTDAYLPRKTSDNGKPVCIGWSGSITTSRYLGAAAPILQELQRTHGVRLRVIGDAGYRIDGAEVEALPWREESELADLSEIDIGLMPLPDDQWARGKCGLKALQYMALSIPTVMSPVGVNRKIAEGGAALLAQSTEEWSSALATLIEDPGLREELGRRGRERVERDYSANAVAPRWTEALRSVAQHGRRSGGR